MGHHRRVHLPISVFLRMAVKSQVEDGRGTRTPRGRRSSLELVQRSERPVLSHPKI